MYAVVQGTIKAVGNFHQPFVQEGGTPYQRGRITLHLPNEVFSQDLKVIKDIIFTIKYSVFPFFLIIRFECRLKLPGYVKITLKFPDHPHGVFGQRFTFVILKFFIQVANELDMWGRISSCLSRIQRPMDDPGMSVE